MKFLCVKDTRPSLWGQTDKKIPGITAGKIYYGGFYGSGQFGQLGIVVWGDDNEWVSFYSIDYFKPAE
jgi:hypothetical protein